MNNTKKKQLSPRLKSDRSINSHSKSRDSLSEIDNQLKPLLTIKSYQHINLNRINSQKNFQSLQKIQQQAYEQSTMKWKSSELLYLNQKNQEEKINPDEKVEIYEPILTITNQDRQEEILRNRYQSNYKILTTQTNQLISFFQFMILQQQIQQTKKKTTQLNIDLRKLRIGMRNHQFTKEINFTFPVEKHNHQIQVKMPSQVPQDKMKKYFFLQQKIANENETYQKQEEKLNNLTAYYLSLEKNHNLQPSINNSGLLKALDSRNSVLSPNSKLKKTVSFQQIPTKSNKQISVYSSISKSPNKRIQTSVRSSEKPLIQKRFFTLEEKKQTLIDGISQFKGFLSQKSNRLIQEIKLIKQHINLISQSLKMKDQNKQILDKKVNQMKKQKEEMKQNNHQEQQLKNKKLTTVTNERMSNYLKEKEKRDVETQGFNRQLRQNKSLSPANYFSSISKKILSNYSPRNVKKLLDN